MEVAVGRSGSGQGGGHNAAMALRRKVARHPRAAAGIPALAVVGVGLWLWVSANLLPYPSGAIPAPTFPFSFCSQPLWLRTQFHETERLGDCLGQLFWPPPTIRVAPGEVFAIGCLPPDHCAGMQGLSSSAGTVVAARGWQRGAFYFQAARPGEAIIWAQFVGPLSCSPPSGGGPQPDRCAAVAVEVVGSA